MTHLSARNRGFTLVELSIVLVIIGLIIGGVLTGQQIIQNARTTNAINAIQSYQAQFSTYAQNYGAVPGDDKYATSRFKPSNYTVSTGDGDGAVGTSSSFDNTTVTEGTAFESRVVWEHLRLAGLVKNQRDDTTIAIQPPNPFGGVYGFQNGAFDGTFSTNCLCLNNVPAEAALAIDTKLDDGLSDSGIIQATQASGTGHGNDKVSSGYDSGVFTLCMRM